MKLELEEGCKEYLASDNSKIVLHVIGDGFSLGLNSSFLLRFWKRKNHASTME